jgi:Extracellular link domain
MNQNQTDFTSETNQVYANMNNFFMNPTVITIIVIIFCIYLAVFMFYGSTSPEMSPSDVSNTSSSTIFMIVIAFVIVLAFIKGSQGLLGSNVFASITKSFSNNPTINVDVITPPTNKNVPVLAPKKEVFNIPENIHTYDDAKAVCASYGAELASYNQIEDAYRNGGEWCNYGWSSDQMALFPTQQSTYNTLQKIEGHEHDCGRPGVNGGYMENSKLKFGANCYGVKPKMTKEDEEVMANTSIYPKTEKDVLFEKRVDYWKDNMDSIIVSPFNLNSWSRY